MIRSGFTVAKASAMIFGDGVRDKKWMWVPLTNWKIISIRIGN